MGSTRQLAAVMFTDIVGYTALMGDDERLAFEVLQQNRLLQKPLIQSHGGTYIKELGDGTLASFPTVIDAVNCACLMIKGSQTIKGLELRIGIHLGDVIFQDGDVFGDSVNIAARLQSLAPVHGIWISESVYKNISNKQGILASFVREEKLKNVKEPILIYEVDINSFHETPIAHHQSVTTKTSPKSQKTTTKTVIYKKYLFWGVLLLALMLGGALSISSLVNKQKARTELIPAIQKLVDSDFRPPIEAFDLANEAQQYVPNDSALIKLWPLVATKLTFDTEPQGAEVFYKDYDNPDDQWRLIGTTPLKDTRIPMTFIRMEIRKEGFQTVEYVVRWSRDTAMPEFNPLKLDSIGSLPENMVSIPSGTTRMAIVGFENLGPQNVSSFLIDRFEVTNKAYMTFVDEGGYRNKAFWKQPIYNGEKEMSFEDATKLFVDRTGQQGPASWEAGTYPNGKESHPVTGVSWYEAAAYAEFVGKKLPTAFHWCMVAATSQTEHVAPLSNFSSTTTTPVGHLAGTSTFGIYDIAGNAREWCFNDNGNPDQHYILGGGYNDPSYAFNDSYTQPALSRGPSNGFRCMINLPGDTLFDQLTGSLDVLFRDFTVEQPVDDQTFEQILRQFNYDKTPLNDVIDITLDQEHWTIEKVSFDAAYGKERMEAYVYVPKNANPPFQPIMYFPGSGDIFSTKFNPEKINGTLDFILKSGRVFVYPIYKGTHERHDGLKTNRPEPTVSYKDHLIMWTKDFSRTVDYLETRKDIQSDKIGLLGWSWGGCIGGIIPAVEKRVKAIVLNVGGLVMNESLPEADQINFLPRVTQPVLMLNGKHDMYFPVETSQKPMFNFLGTPAENKKMVLYESGHLVPRTEFIKETLAWYDQYLGSVNKQ